MLDLENQVRALIGQSIGLLVIMIAVTPCQAQPKTVTTTTSEKRGTAVHIRTYSPVPEATESCTAQESEWWLQIRKASSALQKNGDSKSKTKFAQLFYEGMQKGYRVPLGDRHPQVLVSSRLPEADWAAKQRINGIVVLSIEYRADGTVGDIRLIRGVGARIDESVIRSAREMLFLPAVKDRSFVTEWHTAQVKFSTARQ